MELAAIAAVAGLILTLIGIWVFVRPGFKRSTAVADAILGREEVTDRSGGILEEGQPGLVARVGKLETAVTTLAEVVANQRELHELVLSLQREQNMHSVRLTSLERASDERIAIRRENESLFRAVADRDTINGEVDE